MGRPRRRRKTHWSVSLMDRVAQAVITVSGVGTIAAVSVVGVFLVWVAYPLFWPASFGDREEVLVPEVARPLCLRVDEEQLLAWNLSPEGVLTVFRLDTGETLERRPLVEGKAPTSVSLPFERSRQEGRVKVRYTEVAFGFEDGTVRTCRLRFRSVFPEAGQLPPEVRQLPAGEVATAPAWPPPMPPATLACCT